MNLLSVNTGRARLIERGGGAEQTGIFKASAEGPVQVGPLGLGGDAVCDVRNHGGEDQAVYLYGVPDYDWWAEALGRELAPGTFGENLTVAGLESATLAVGDRLEIGEVLLEVTAPRIPCGKLAARMGDPAFVKRFRHAERPGAYCRVLRGGAVQAGDTVRLLPYAGERLGVVELFRDYFEPNLSEAALRRQLAAPIAVRARRDTEARLEKLLSS